MKHTTLLILFSLYFCSVSAQIKNVRVYQLDSISSKAIHGEVGYLLSASHSEGDDHIDLTSLLTLKGKYILPSGTDFILSGHQFFERDGGGAFVNRNYIILASSIKKYKISEDGNCQARKMYIQPYVTLRNNSDKGLRYRGQVGVLFHPLTIYAKKTMFDIGVGITANHQSWRIRDYSDSDFTDLESSDPEKWEKINFIADNMANENGHYSYSDTKAALYLNTSTTFNKKFHIDVALLYEQALSMPYDKVITDKYAELKTPYPSVIADIDFSVDITKKLAVKVKMTFDWEKSIMSLYSSRYSSYCLVGLSYSLRGKSAK